MPFRIARLPLTFLVLAFAMTLGSGCTKRTPALASAHPGEGGAGAEGDGAAQARTQQLQEGPDVRAIGGEGASGSDIPGGAFTGEGGPLADIHFQLDSAALSDEARSTLEKHALWLQGQRGARVTVEGHCDERGTVEYNLALGEQRARAARDYLVSLGVGQDRLRVVSFGKERPLAAGGDESSYAQNRRAHFAVALSWGDSIPPGPPGLSLLSSRYDSALSIPVRVPALFALAVACLAALPVEAANKDIERLAMQIATLQSQLSEIQRSGEETRAELKRLSELVAEQNALLRKSAADKRTNDEAMAVGLRELSERVSELAEAIQAIKATFPLPPANMSVDPNAAPAGGTAAAPAGPGGPAPVTSPSPVPVAPTGPPPAPRELYSQAYADYARGNYDLAMQGFAEYLRAYPGTDFADNAQYWIGECLYGKKMYAESIEAWNTLLKDFPSSDKLPDARVKKGMALERLGRKSQALVEYRYVVDRYPTSQAARIARERLNP